MKNLERGQGLIEYALILILLVVIVIVVSSIFQAGFQHVPQPSLEHTVQQTLDAYEQWVDTCVATERYDRETCEQLGLRGD